MLGEYTHALPLLWVLFRLRSLLEQAGGQGLQLYAGKGPRATYFTGRGLRATAIARRGLRATAIAGGGPRASAVNF